MKIIDIDKINYSQIESVDEIKSALDNSNQISFDEFIAGIVNTYNNRYGFTGYPPTMVAQCCEAIALQCGMKDFF